MPAVNAQEGTGFSVIENLVVITCCNCGIPFAVPDHWRLKKRESTEGFWCPNGHKQWYRKSAADILKEQLSQKQRELDSAKSSERFHRDQAASARRSASAHAGVAKRRKRQLDRVQNGVCPCCNRHFENLERHMHSMHPDHGK